MGSIKRMALENVKQGIGGELAKKLSAKKQPPVAVTVSVESEELPEDDARLLAEEYEREGMAGEG